jgi:class 3 adenylate cyclase
MKSRPKNIDSAFESLELLAQERQTQYILFADLCGSTQYKKNLLKNGVSNSYWMLRQLIFLQETAKHFRTYKGVIIKTLGDGIMATFDYSEPPSDLIYASVELILFFRKSAFFCDNDKIEIKISLDFGETINGAIIDGLYDPVGLCVDRCARLNSKTGPSRVSFSSDFDSRIKLSDKTSIHSGIKKCNENRKELKGIGDTVFFELHV